MVYLVNFSTGDYFRWAMLKFIKLQTLDQRKELEFFSLHPGLRRLNFPLKTKKGREGESLALLQI